jgi:hypothetical protein
MSAARREGTLRLKLTISREEHPAMFEALSSIRNPRRRAGRLKDLVIRALLLEQAGATLTPPGTLPEISHPGAGANGAALAAPPGPSVAAMLDWDSSQA